MKEIRSKKSLEIVLSRIPSFKTAKVRKEQYMTPSSIAAEILWNAYYNGDIEGKVISDLGCGTGILGIGCLVLGAKRVIFVDNDVDAMAQCKENVAKLQSERLINSKFEFVESDVKVFTKISDTIVMNPPFGTKKKHADKEFLERAFILSKVTYSFHKTSTKEYIMALAKAKNFATVERFDFNYLLPNTMKNHTKGKAIIKVSCFYFKSMGM